jgi:hypothetical protein
MVHKPTTKIDLKTASREDLIEFVKKQNAHMKSLEIISKKLEARYKEQVCC